MQRLAVLRHDRGERHPLAVGFGDALDGTRDFALHNARAAHPHGCGVHAVADAEGPFEGLDLLGALLLAHFGHGHHQLYRLVVVEHGRRDAQQRRELELRLAAVGRQVVDAAALGDGARKAGLQFGHGVRCADADLGAHLAQRGLRAGPDDVLHGKVVAVERLLARVGVDDSRDARHVQPEVVAERRILAEVVGVIGVVVGRKRIAGQQDEARSDARAQLVAACGVGLC